MNRRRGSTTVEAALIFPIIFISICAVIYYSIVHYQNIVATSAAMQSANRIASTWQFIGDNDPTMFREVTSAADLLTAAAFLEKDPYRFLIDSNSEKRLENARKYTLRLAKNVPTNYYSKEAKQEDITVEKESNFFISYIKVSIVKQHTNPFGRVFEKLGFQSIDNRTVTAKSVLNSPSELIRNVDFIKEIIDDLSE